MINFEMRKQVSCVASFQFYTFFAVMTDGSICSLALSIFTALCILFYSSVSTYVGLYGSGLFNFVSYVSFPTLFTCFLGFDIPTSSFIFIENVFYYSLIIIIMMKILPVLPLAGSLP